MKTTQKLIIIGMSLALIGQSRGKAQPFLKDGLVAYYPLDGNAIDTSGNGNDGVALDTVSDKNRLGRPNSSLYFNGDTSQLSVAKPLLDLGRDYTISFWFKLKDASRRQQMLVDTHRTWGLAIDYNDSPSTPPGVINWAVGAGGSGWTVSYIHGDKADYQSGLWYQLTFRKAQHDYQMFIDGRLESALTVPNDFSFAPSEWDFGFLAGRTAQLNGNLDDIHIFNRALSSLEVKLLFEMESGPSVAIHKSVRPSFSNLQIGAIYQLQVSSDLNTWTNSGSPFTAVDSTLDQPQHWEVENWGSLSFRLLEVP
jgi:hypothetical protein